MASLPGHPVSDQPLTQASRPAPQQLPIKATLFNTVDFRAVASWVKLPTSFHAGELHPRDGLALLNLLFGRSHLLNLFAACLGVVTSGDP